MSNTLGVAAEDQDFRFRRFAACSGAWPLAWPLPTGPLGRQRLQGQRHAAGVSRAAGCETPLRLEGPTRTMRGVPAPALRPLWRRRKSHVADGLVLADWRDTGPMRRAPHAAGHRTTGRGSSARRRASARRERRKLPHRQRRAPDLTPAAHGGPPLAAHHSPLLYRPVFRASPPGRQARRAGGVPLKP